VKIPDEKVAIVTQRLLAKVPGLKPCLQCGTTNWSLNSEIVMLPSFEQGGVFASRTSTPAVVLVCPTCGHLLLFSAIVAGLMDAKTGALNLD
jgi:hypothetical protein